MKQDHDYNADEAKAQNEIDKADWTSSDREADRALDILPSSVVGQQSITAKMEEALLINDSFDRIAYYKENSEHYGLCAWCRHYWGRATETKMDPKLTDEQYKETQTDDTSHGMCPDCAVKARESAKKVAAVEADPHQPEEVEVTLTDEAFERLLDDQYGDVQICGMVSSSGRTLRLTDRVAFDEQKHNYESNIPNQWECAHCDDRYQTEEIARNCGCILPTCAKCDAVVENAHYRDQSHLMYCSVNCALSDTPPPVHGIGTPVVVTSVDETISGGFGDKRNIGRYGMVVNVIVKPTAANPDALYEIGFVDGIQHRSPYLMDEEANMPDGHSTHFHSELETTMPDEEEEPCCPNCHSTDVGNVPAHGCDEGMVRCSECNWEEK